MTPKFPVATKLATAATVAMLAAAALAMTNVAASAQSPNYDSRGRVTYGPNGPNSSYQAGPRTRVFITKRSWLDAGTEVLPGERKFSDYAYPPGVSFGRENFNRPIDRQPLSPPSDFGSSDAYGGVGRFPIP